jgi:hypothetical protein
MLDFQNTSRTIDLPVSLDFEPVFEPSRQARHKYVIDNNTGEVLGHVGHTFKCASHRKFFEGVWKQVTTNMEASDVADANIRFQSGRNGGFGLMDVRFPSISTKVATDKHQVSISQRIIALHSVDGGAGSNTTLFGAIDGYCLNGMVSGEHSKVLRRNSSNFSMKAFIEQLKTSKQDFYEASEQLKVFAATKLTDDTVKRLLDSLLSPNKDPQTNREHKSDKMYSLYQSEAEVRGKNKFALLSAFTNYSTYADDRNGFALRTTDTSEQNRVVNMISRELDVHKWIRNEKFLEAV